MPGFDPTDYAVYVLETYRRAKGLSGAQVAELFDQAGVFGFLEDCADTLHCQGDDATIADIDAFIQAHAPSLPEPAP